jgi:hypothetical protein
MVSFCASSSRKGQETKTVGLVQNKINSGKKKSWRMVSVGLLAQYAFGVHTQPL